MVVAVSALWTLPVWLAAVPPMVDYPQHLAMAAMLRFWGDPARGFSETYRLVWSTPNSAWEWLAAGAAFVLPIEPAGKLLVALPIAALGPAALVLARRLGRPDWSALLPLAAAYGYAFSWGMVGTLLAYPMILAGLALADRLFAGRFGAGSWLALALLAAAFYGIHVEFLALFVGAAAWLALCRLPGLRRWLLQVSALLPAVALAAAAVLLPQLLGKPGSYSLYEQAMQAEGVRYHPLGLKLFTLPSLVLGARPALGEAVPAALLLALALLVVIGRPPIPPASFRERLLRSRFALLGAGLAALYLLLPEFALGYLIAERIAALAFMIGVLTLPPPPSRGRAAAAAALAAGALALQLVWAASEARAFEREAAGARQLLLATEPGRSLAGLIYDPYPSRAREGSQLLRYPLFTHFPALYQVDRGGRVLFSFAELGHGLVKYRPGRGWDPELLARVADRNPRAFSLARDGPHFDYLLARGDWPEIQAALGPELSHWEVRSIGRWHLLRKRPPARSLE